MSPHPIWVKIDELRTKRAMSYSVLARLSGVGRSTLLSWAAGATPNPGYAADVLGAMGLSPSEIDLALLSHPRFQRSKALRESHGAAKSAQGLVLTGLRVQHQCTREELAQRLGCNLSTVRRLENGDITLTEGWIDQLTDCLGLLPAETSALRDTAPSPNLVHERLLATKRLPDWEEILGRPLTSLDYLEVAGLWPFVAARASLDLAWKEPALELAIRGQQSTLYTTHAGHMAAWAALQRAFWKSVGPLGHSTMVAEGLADYADARMGRLDPATLARKNLPKLRRAISGLETDDAHWLLQRAARHCAMLGDVQEAEHYLMRTDEALGDHPIDHANQSLFRIKVYELAGNLSTAARCFESHWEHHRGVDFLVEFRTMIAGAELFCRIGDSSSAEIILRSGMEVINSYAAQQSHPWFLDYAQTEWKRGKELVDAL